ncbi:MAG: MBL fold metallo-hydrolase [Nitrospirota bacterium]|nr:MBL fold metallo-hydrolase [Nitrospirota bacterium]
MFIEKFVVGPLGTNAYIIGDEKTKNAVVVDPGDEADRMLDLIKEKSFRINAIICTHGHFDHVGAVGDMKMVTGAKILMHKNDMETYAAAKDQAAFWGFGLDDQPKPDGFVEEGDEIKVGGLSFKVLHTPGHSRGGICLYGEGVLISGDTIFQGSVGRTDFPGGSHEMLKKSFKRLLDLPDETKVYSGHGPETTIGRERKTNFFVSELG